MARSQAVPIFVDPSNQRVPLERIRLGAGVYSEDWLQQLIHHHPEILPVTDVEPGFGDAVAVAREVPCGHGFIDNLYITPSGDIILVEAKLWRNSEMRREVVAQVLDYISALTRMSYADFEAAISKGQGAKTPLYSVVSALPEALDEAQFIDAVVRNLKRGRLLAMIVGDGIRSETETLAELLQSYAGAHFTFALVELATWRNEAGALLVVPSTLAKTVMIERGIVRVDSGVRIEPVPAIEKVQPQSISLSDFWEKMAERNPGLPAAIRDLLADLEPLGVYPDLKASLSLKIDLPDFPRPVSFGFIQKNGQFWTSPASGAGIPEAAWRPYLETLASLVGGEVTSGIEKYVAVNKRSAPRIDEFLPQHKDALVVAIQEMMQALDA